MAYVRQTVVKRLNWMDEPGFRTGLAMCQLIPGATLMQVCAYVGLKMRGVRGAITSFVAFALPAFLLMLGLSALYARFQELPAVAAAFAGLQALIIGIMANATFTFGKSYLKRWPDFLIATAAAVLFWFGVNPILVVLGSAAVGAAVPARKGNQPAPAVTKPMRFPVIPLGVILGSAVAILAALFLLDRPAFDLSALMLRIDLFAFGGGFASVPLMLHEVVNVRQWMDPKVFMDGIALGQITPGPIVITATFVGFVLQGVLGAVVATVSIFLPSFTLVLITTPVFSRLGASSLFRKAITGVLCSFVGLLLSSAVRLGFNVSWDIPRIVLSCAALAALVLGVDTVWVVLGGIAFSLAFR